MCVTAILLARLSRENGWNRQTIMQAVKIDLDGDGEDEMLISATHYKDGEKIPDEPTANTYSFVLLARFAQRKAETELVAGEFYPESKSDAAPNKFEIVAPLDLNGDGKIDSWIDSGPRLKYLIIKLLRRSYRWKWIK